MFHALGVFITKFSWWILGVTAAFLVIAGIYGPGVFGKLSSGGFENSSSESYRADQAIQSKLPASQASVIVLLKGRHNESVNTVAFRTEATKILDKIKDEEEVNSVTSYYATQSPALISKDHLQMFATVSLKGDAGAQSKAVDRLRTKLSSDMLEVKLGGTAAINSEITSIIGKDLAKAESISFSLLAVLLIVVFRSFIAGLLPLILGAVSVLGAFLVTRLLTSVTDISEYAINVIILLGLGLAVDYSLFIVSRFREELRGGASVADSLHKTMQTAGRTVLFSGVTVILSLLGLLLFPLNFLQSMGLGGAAAVGVSMIAALLVLPAILARLGRNVNALSFGSVRQQHRAHASGRSASVERKSLWYRISRGVMRRPVLALAVVIAPLVLLAMPFLHVRFGTPDYRSLPAGTEARAVSESLHDNFQNQESPIEVVYRSTSELTQPGNMDKLYDYTEQLEALPGVERVDSAVSSGYRYPDKASFLAAYAASDGWPAPRITRAIKDNTTMVSVSYTFDSLSPDTQKLVEAIRHTAVPDGAVVLVGGEPAALTDLLGILAHALPFAAIFVMISLFILLFLMLGSFVIPLQAIVLNILSLTASFGVLVWIFQDGNLAHWFNFTPDGTINATQPILIFAIAFGLSMDYAVFLLSRIKEQYSQSGNTQEAVATGIQKTGNIITSAAVLLFVVVAAFATSSIPLIKQIGVGLSLAILIDAFVIRMLLVPAVMKLFSNTNWWAPKRLQRLAAHVGFSEKG